MIFYVGAVAVAAACGYYWVSQRRLRKRTIEQIYQWPPMNPSQYFHTHFNGRPDLEQIAERIQLILGEETGLDFSRISPDERFDGPMGNILDGMDTIEALIRIEEEFKIKITDEEAESVKSFAQLIELAAGKIN